MPIVLQQLFSASLQLIDNLMVGQLGDFAVGSVAVVNQLYFVIYLLTFGSMGGAGIFLSQYFGSKSYEKLKETFRFKIIVGLGIATFSLLLFSIFGRFFITLFTKNSVTLANSLDYLNVIKWSLFPWVLSVAISTSFREIGSTKDLLKISIVAVTTNTFLNYLLIFGNLGFPALGVKGAAIATLIARFVEVFLYYLLIKFKGRIFNINLLKLFKIEKTVIKAVVIMAIPLTINELFWSMGQTMFLQAYSTRGDFAIAAMSINSAVSQIVFVTIGGIGTGISVMVGKVLGENKLKEAKENAIKIMYFAVFLALLMGLILFILSYFIMDLYSVSAETKAITIYALRINALMIPIMSLNVTIYFTLRSGGDTRSTILMDSAFVWTIQVPTVFLISRLTNLPVTILFLIVQGLEIPKMLYGFTRFNRDTWMKNLAIESIGQEEIMIEEKRLIK